MTLKKETHIDISELLTELQTTRRVNNSLSLTDFIVTLFGNRYLNEVSIKINLDKEDEITLAIKDLLSWNCSFYENEIYIDINR